MTTLQNYRCWFFVNQHIKEREFEAFEQLAANTFLDFISDKDYGDSIRLFRFDIYVEPKVNFGHQNDSIYTGCAHLSTHIGKQLFDKADDNYKLKLFLNASLVLIKYLSQRVALPKDFQADNLYEDFESFLETKSLMLSQGEIDKAIIKPFDTTRFRFLITTTWEVKNKDIHYDLNDIEDFVNNKLAGQTFGTSVRKFDFGYEIFDFKGDFLQFHEQTANLRRYGAKYKNLLVVKQFDYRQIKELDKKKQFDLLKTRILEAISDIEKLNKKPKGFDKQRFYDTMEDILTSYDKQKYSR
jgi:hypothetical protein